MRLHFNSPYKITNIMDNYEIYWDDLTPEAQERLKGMNHENIDLSPIAIIEIEADEKFFLWKDKTGRGETAANVPLSSLTADIGEDGDYISDDEQTLSEWAIEAEIGDTWETSTDYYIRTA